MHATAVHIFGRHLEAVDWAKHQFADFETKRLGAVAKALILAVNADADFISLGTGASGREGVPEAEYTRRYALAHLDRLATLPQFNGIDIERCRRFLTEACCEITSHNTTEEIAAISQMYLARGVRNVFAVTCPTHAPRCLRDLWEAWNRPEFRHFQDSFALITSDVPFTGSSPKDVAILEPPHRGDNTSPPFYKLIPRIFKVPSDKRAEFYSKLETMLRSYTG
ncbi:MAG: hypothetical protein Q7R83_02730 [bacterium]|nr:hypothetical protein [bacterium]